MKRKTPNSPRRMWIKEEDDLLRTVVMDNSKLTWKEIACIFNSESIMRQTTKNKKSEKSGKQCRERFRNYLDNNVIDKAWSKDEKILFMLLHSVYGNHWSEIARFYPNKNDLSMKNFFYSYMRKVLKKIRNKANSLYKPRRSWKVLYLSYMINLIRQKYFPSLKRRESRNARATQDITILNVLKTSGQDEKVLKKFVDKVMQKLMAESDAKDFPIVLTIDSEKFGWSYLRKKTLNGIIKRQNLGELSQVFEIQITESLSAHQPRECLAQSIESPLASLHFPSPLSPCIYPDSSAYQLTNPSLQPIISSPEVPIHLKSGAVGNFEEGKHLVRPNSNVFSPMFLPPSISLAPQICLNSLAYPIYPPYPLNGFYGSEGFYMHPMGGQVHQWSEIKEREKEGKKVVENKRKGQGRTNPEDEVKIHISERQKKKSANYILTNKPYL